MNLYHYTDQNGFLSIIKNENLWASQIQFLNDKNEYHLAFNIAEKILDTKLKNSTNQKYTMLRFKASLKQIKSINYCVCSLTENGDLLSQWRGYTNSSCGYSIGFNKEILQLMLESKKLCLKRCVYEPSEQENLIEDVIDTCLYKYLDYSEPEPEFPEVESDSSKYFKEQISMLSPLIKDKSFQKKPNGECLVEFHLPN